MTRILYVEDLEDLRDLFKVTTAMQQPSWQVDMAASGASALNMFASARNGEAPYDLIVWDISMPDFSGLKAASVIRDAGDSQTKFMIYSARDGHDDRVAAENVGAVAYLVKATVTPRQLIQEIARVLGQA